MGAAWTPSRSGASRPGSTACQVPVGDAVAAARWTRPSPLFSSLRKGASPSISTSASPAARRISALAGAGGSGRMESAPPVAAMSMSRRAIPSCPPAWKA